MDHVVCIDGTEHTVLAAQLEGNTGRLLGLETRSSNQPRSWEQQHYVLSDQI